MLAGQENKVCWEEIILFDFADITHFDLLPLYFDKFTFSED